MQKNIQTGLILSISLIALFILSLYITTLPKGNDPAIRFGILTLLPPLVAIGLAFFSRNTIISLFLGAFVGEFMLCVNDWNIINTIISAYIHLSSQIIIAMAEPWHAGIILQTLLIGGIIQLVSRMGGAKAIADTFAKRADTPVKAQLVAMLLGLCIFFDDYSSTLITGPIMRPITDSLRISREKLAFIVDSTAAPIVNISIIATWIGLELSLISSSLDAIGLSNMSAFSIFLETIPCRFYNIFLFIFIIITAVTLYEFGPMKKAEQRARKGERAKNDEKPQGFDEVLPIEGIKLSIWNAIIPLGTLIVGAIIAFYWSGYTSILSGNDHVIISIMKTAPLSPRGIFEAFAASNASVALFQAALLASIVTVVMAAYEKIMTVGQAIDEWIEGMKTIVITSVILLLAWSLGDVIGEMGTAIYLVNILNNSIPPFIIPALIFIFGAIISFSTGTSFGTMSIMMPLAIPLAWTVSGGDIGFTVICTSAVFSGSVFGDHTSPISDTTILSAMGTSCSLVDHVDTQLPYGIFIAAITILAGYLPAGLGVPFYISLPLGCIALYLGLRVLGERVGFEEAEG